MSVLKVKNGNQWDIVPAIKGDTGDPAADESITDGMLVPDGIKTEIEWLWGNQLTDELEGDILQTEDAYKGPIVSLGVDGKSTQVTTTGKNLVDPDKMANGYIDTNGAVTGSTNTYKHSDYIPVTPGTAYTISQGGVAFSGDIRYVFYDSEKVFISPYYVHGNSTNFQLTAPEGASYFRASFNGPQAAYAMVEEGTNYTGFEPYTGGKASPSPDYPQPILSVDDLSLVLAGKNLFDATQMKDQAAWNTIPVYAPVGTTLTMSTDKNTGSAGTSGDLPTYFRQPSSSQGTSNLVNYHHHVTQTVGAQGFVEVVQRRASGTDSFANYQWQIELGSTATAYQPYTGTTVPDLLPDGTSLRSLQDGTKDALNLSYLRPSTRPGWAWYSREVVRRIGIGTITKGGYTGGEFDTTNGFTLYAPWLVFGITNANISASANNIRCDKLQAVVANDTTKTNVIWAKGTNLVVNLAGYTTRSDASAALIVLAPVVHYVLATPVTTTLDPIELPIMPSDKATVWSDPSANLKLAYILDSNLVIEGLESTIADLATS